MAGPLWRGLFGEASLARIEGPPPNRPMLVASFRWTSLIWQAGCANLVTPSTVR